ncbi:MAG: hypothetical protein ABI627_18735 [Polyangiaceae bacterium]
MEQQMIAAFSPAAISAVIVAIVMAASRLAPFTKPYWAFLPKAVQAGLPSLVAGLPLALNSFGAVKTWLDFAQALLVVGVVPLSLAVPGMRTAHDQPAPPPPSGTNPSPSGGDKPNPPTFPPLAAAALFLLCMALPGCGAFGSPEPNFAHAAVYIADAGNAVSAAEALLPSLNLSSDEVTQAKELIARARAAVAAAAAATNGAKDLTTEQLDASLAAFRAAWTDIEQVIAGKRLVASGAAPALAAPLCTRSSGQ